MKNVTKDLQLNRKENDSMLKVKTTVNRFQAKNKDMALQFVPAIKNNNSDNFKSDIVEVTLDELENAILAGKSIIPAVVEKNIIDAHFKEQQLFMIDIDDADCNLEELLKRFKDYEPCMVYTSFSHTPEHPKYRFVFIADKVIEDKETAKKINLGLMKIAGCADVKCKDASRIFFAGKSVPYKKEVTFNSKKLLKEVVSDVSSSLLKEIKASVKAPKTKKAQTQALNSEIVTRAEIEANLAKVKDSYNGKKIDYEGSFEWFNKNVNLTDVLGKELNQKFRCLLDTHLDEHPSASITEYEGQQYYRCSCDDFYSPKSLIDTVSMLLGINKAKTEQVLADALGITIGSEYQRETRLYIAEYRAKLRQIIEPGSILDKEMKFLYGAYNCILDFISNVCQPAPITKDIEKISFFMSERQLSDEMRRLDMRGSSNAKNKIDQLKELGLIRPLTESELKTSMLEKSKTEQEKLKLKINKSVVNRVECYELVDLSPAKIMEIEAFIVERKRLGMKKRNNNITRRANTFGLQTAQELHVQVDVVDKVESDKNNKRKEKLVACADKLIQKQRYFTVDDLRKEFDPKRRMKKVVSEKIIDDFIPTLIGEYGYEKSRVKNETRQMFNIPAKIKTNTIIFIRNC